MLVLVAWCWVLNVCKNEIKNAYGVGIVSIKHKLLFDPRGVILVQVTVIAVNCSEPRMTLNHDCTVL